MSFIKNLFGTKPHPIEVVQEVKTTTASQFSRNLSRLVTLYEVKEQGDERQEVDAEIKARIKACVDMGHDAPVDIHMAKALQQKVVK